jgi:NADPH:quinone reductase-like Zn-dependent oxidoreductase
VRLVHQVELDRGDDAQAGRLAAGERILIIGAGGGVGTFGIQLAKSRAHVTAVDRRSKLDRLAGLGADRVVDFAKADPLAVPGGFDLIVDVVARRPMLAYGGRWRRAGGWSWWRGRTAACRSSPTCCKPENLCR